jgi:membrane protein DedA with SNARE-associated domain
MHLFVLYLALFFGVMLEGEVALIAGALAAQKGMLNIYLVVLTAFLSTILTDWAWFFTGRMAGIKVLAKFDHLEKRSARIHRWLTKYPVLIVLLYRYLYGFRIVTLLVMGVSRFPVKQYLFLSLFSIFTWSVLIGVAGYYLGELITRTFKRYENYSIYFIVGLAAGFFIILFLRKILRKILNTSNAATDENTEAIQRNLGEIIEPARIQEKQ